MARAPIPIAVIDRVTGAAVVGASVTIRKVDDNSLATVYAARTGGTTVANPLATDANGRVTGFCERDEYKCTISGGTPAVSPAYDENWNATPAADRSVDPEWASAALIPLGIVLPFAGSASPSGEWLLCDGAAVSRSTYQALFNTIGTAYGSGDGSTTFNLPDMRGRMPVGKGPHGDVDTLGENEGANAGDRRPKHKTSKGSLDVGDITLYADATRGDLATHNMIGPDTAGGAVVLPGPDLTGEAGDMRGGAQTDTVPYLVTNYLIKAL
jgi:microcystin-dependent protein